MKDKLVLEGNSHQLFFPSNYITLLFISVEITIWGINMFLLANLDMKVVKFHYLTIH